MSADDAVDGALAEMLTGCTVCRAWAEQDEGPYHRDAEPERRDVVEDRDDGVVLQLGIRLALHTHAPSSHVIVEIWQCDALGRYSGFPPPEPSTVAAATAPRATYLSDQTFLRGRQRADSAGMVEFHTIYPGWYPGRTVHSHVMVHTAGQVFTSQLYFPDETSDHVLAQMPYAIRPGRDTTNDTDEVFATGGDPAVLEVVPNGDGYRAAICLELPGPEHDS